MREKKRIFIFNAFRIGKTRSDSMTSNKRCSKCLDNAITSGLFTCDGCQNRFCLSHVNQHREELRHELEIVVQGHDDIKQQLSQPSLMDQDVFDKIDLWEKKSIATIRKTAEAARNDLLKLIDSKNQSVSSTCQQIASDLQRARKTDNFSEIDLQQWSDQLDELKTSLQSSTAYELVREKDHPIRLIRLQEKMSLRPFYMFAQTLNVQEKFDRSFGPVSIDRNGTRCTYVGNSREIGRIRGLNGYSRDRVAISFKIEKSSSPDELFFGIMTSNANLDQRLWSDSSTVGWCGLNCVWKHGSYNDLLYGSVQRYIRIGATLELILLCDQQKIELYYEALETPRILDVDLKQTPFPWHFVIGLRTEGDCVCIFQNR